jgi:hypothetical protein
MVVDPYSARIPGCSLVQSLVVRLKQMSPSVWKVAPLFH